jgi:hypothetical protein
MSLKKMRTCPARDRWFLDRIATHILVFEGIAKLSEEFDFGNIGAYGLYALNLLNSNVRRTYVTCRTTSLPNHNVYNRDGELQDFAVY